MSAGVNPLIDVATRLAAIPCRDLDALSTTVNRFQQRLPGLLAWLEHAIDWEQRRRDGFEFPLRGPMKATPYSQARNSIVAIHVLASMFRDNVQHDSMAIAALLDLVETILRAEFARPGTLQ